MSSCAKYIFTFCLHFSPSNTLYINTLTCSLHLLNSERKTMKLKERNTHKKKQQQRRIFPFSYYSNENALRYAQLILLPAVNANEILQHSSVVPPFMCHFKAKFIRSSFALYVVFFFSFDFSCFRTSRLSNQIAMVIPIFCYFYT